MNKKLSWAGGALGACFLVGFALAQGGGSGHGTIVIKVPADAKVTIGGQETRQTGPTRTFHTQELAPGRYQYEFTVTWTEGGVAKKAVKWVEVAVGSTTNVDLTTPTVVAKKEDDKKVIKKPDETKKAEKPLEPKARKFLFTYSGTAKDLKPGQEASIWLPFPQTTAFQNVELVDQTIPGDAPPRLAQEKEYGNKMLFFSAKANDKGEIPFSVTYRVERMEVLGGGKDTLSFPKEKSESITRFLMPDKLVPISGKPLELLKGKKLGTNDFEAAKTFYDVVNNHMKYDKPAGKPWGRGDAVWACDSKFGNCTDFHSIFISMARGNKIPAKFEMGFSIPEKIGKGDIGGYHCWAWFMPEGKGWIPVDISEANRFPDMRDYYFGNLTVDRVQFTTGRDINLVPQQKGAALNFFIYPYVEVDGMPYPNEKVARQFAYQDVK